MKNSFISGINNKRTSYRNKENNTDKKIDFDILSGSGRNSLHSSENEKDKKYNNYNQSSSKLLKIIKKIKIELVYFLQLTLIYHQKIIK